MSHASVSRHVSESATYMWVLSPISVRNVTYISQSRHKFKWDMSIFQASRHIRDFATNRKSYYTYKWVTPHVLLSRVAHKWGMSHVQVSQIWVLSYLQVRRHISESATCKKVVTSTHTNESRHTYEWVVSHINESCHTYKCHIYGLCHIFYCVVI